ncbi:hypothetical protein CCP3SC5AM1_2890004 [Gammaproteobacteria bacterium]
MIKIVTSADKVLLPVDAYKRWDLSRGEAVIAYINSTKNIYLFMMVGTGFCFKRVNCDIPASNLFVYADLCIQDVAGRAGAELYYFDSFEELVKAVEVNHWNWI